MRCSIFLLLPWLFSCGGSRPEASAPVSLLEGAPPAVRTSVELRYETRRAIQTGIGDPLELRLTLPRAPVLRFAIAAASKERPTLLAPVAFRVRVDGTEVFHEVLRRAQGETWHPREVELSRWSGKEALVTLEASLGEGGVEDAESHLVAYWANPVLSSLSAPPAGPNLVLISIDCLRADHLGSYGYPRDTTPNLDAFARQSVVFEDASAASSFTLPTHASMLTGLPPSLHGATTRRRISRAVAYLPELLARKGYQVQGVVSGPFLSSVYGFDEGFHTYRLSPARAEGLVDHALALLDEGAGSRQFLFLHVFDAHAPYSPPGEFLDRFGERPEDVSDLHDRLERRLPPSGPEEIEDMKNLYDAEIAYVDRELGRFFEGLRERELYDSSLIVVTADHGEAFYEHGFWEHARPWQSDGPRMYQEILHVPLVVKWPGESGEKRVETPVSQSDIFPTFAEAAGLEASTPWAQSLGLHRQGSGEGPGSRFVLSEFLSTPARGGAMLEIALRRGDLKYLVSFRSDTVAEVYRAEAQEEALYDLAEDPEESRPLDPDAEDEISEMRAFLSHYLAAALAAAEGSLEEDVKLPPELLEELESLGYLEH